MNQTVTLTVVVAVNNAPTSTAIADDTINEGLAYSYDVSTSFYDQDGDTLAYSLSGAPVGFSINSSGVIS